MRIVQQRIEIDYKQVEDFFRARGENAAGLTATMYGDQDPTVAARRDEVEKARVLPLLGALAQGNVLEIGCGLGRWAPVIAASGGRYLGFDRSKELIEAARRLQGDCGGRASFEVLDACELHRAAPSLPGPFQVVLVTALLLYLNDADCENILRSIVLLAAEDALVYIREPVSLLEDRLTLVNHYSEELRAHYNAVYRTEREYREWFSTLLLPAGFVLAETDFIFDKQLHNRAETRHRFFALKRSAALTGALPREEPR